MAEGQAHSLVVTQRDDETRKTRMIRMSRAGEGTRGPPETDFRCELRERGRVRGTEGQTGEKRGNGTEVDARQFSTIIFQGA